MTITATWNTVYIGPSVTTTLPGAIQWWRVTNWPDGRVLSVSAGAGNPLLDTQYPLSPGGATTYYAQSDSGASESSAVFTAPVIDHPILGVPSDPTQQAQPVVVLTQREWTVTGRTAIYEVLGRTVPWVEPIPPIERRGQLVLRMEHPGGGFPGTALDRVRDMLKTGKPLQLRTVCPERVETISFVMTSVTEVHVGQPNAHGPDRLVDISWQAVEPLYGEDIAVAKRLWFQVPIEFGTWADVEASGLSWDELAWGTT
jgi:hypothetical protein